MTGTYQRVPLSGARVRVEPARARRAQHPFVGFVDFQGLQVDLENLRGSYREGTDPNGKRWRVKMGHHYGEIRGTEGTDGDKLDVYIGPHADSTLVVIVHQQDPDTRRFDEDKVMLGFATVPEALVAYRAQYDRRGFYGGHSVLSIGTFWRWVKDPARRGKKMAKGRLHDVIMAGQGWIRCSRAEYLRRLAGGLFKGAGHKYLRKVWRNGRWNYYYNVAHGGGLGAHEDMAVEHDGKLKGASFKMRDRESGQEGHWQVVHAEGDKLHLKHDESGRVVTMTRRELELRLHREHARDFAKQRQKYHEGAQRARTNKREAAAKRFERLHEATGVKARRPDTQKPTLKPGAPTGKPSRKVREPEPGSVMEALYRVDAGKGGPNGAQGREGRKAGLLEYKDGEWSLTDKGRAALAAHKAATGKLPRGRQELEDAKKHARRALAEELAAEDKAKSQSAEPTSVVPTRAKPWVDAVERARKVLAQAEAAGVGRVHTAQVRNQIAVFDDNRTNQRFHGPMTAGDYETAAAGLAAVVERLRAATKRTEERRRKRTSPDKVTEDEQRQREEAARRSAEKRRKFGVIEGGKGKVAPALADEVKRLESLAAEYASDKFKASPESGPDGHMPETVQRSEHDRARESYLAQALAVRLIAEGKTMGEARKAALAKYPRKGKYTGSPVHEDAVRRAIRDALELKGKTKADQPRPSADDRRKVKPVEATRGQGSAGTGGAPLTLASPEDRKDDPHAELRKLVSRAERYKGDGSKLGRGALRSVQDAIVRHFVDAPDGFDAHAGDDASMLPHPRAVLAAMERAGVDQRSDHARAYRMAIELALDGAETPAEEVELLEKLERAEGPLSGGQRERLESARKRVGDQVTADEQRQREEAARKSADKRRKAPEAPKARTKSFDDMTPAEVRARIRELTRGAPESAQEAAARRDVAEEDPTERDQEQGARAAAEYDAEQERKARAAAKKKRETKRETKKAASETEAGAGELHRQADAHAKEATRIHDELKGSGRDWRNRDTYDKKRDALIEHLKALRDKRMKAWTPDGPDTTGLESVVKDLDARVEKRVAFRDTVKKQLQRKSLSPRQLKHAMAHLDAASTGQPVRRVLKAGGAAAKRAEDAYHAAIEAARDKHGDVDLKPLNSISEGIHSTHRRLKEQIGIKRAQHDRELRAAGLEEKWGLTQADRNALRESVNMGGALDTDDQVERALQQPAEGHRTWFDQPTYSWADHKRSRQPTLKPSVDAGHLRGLDVKATMATEHVGSDAEHDLRAGHYARMVADAAQEAAAKHAKQLEEVTSGHAGNVLKAREQLLSKVEAIEKQRGRKTPLGDSLRQQVQQMRQRRDEMKQLKKPGDFVRHALGQLEATRPEFVSAIRRNHPEFAAGKADLGDDVGRGVAKYAEPPKIKTTSKKVEIGLSSGATHSVSADVAGDWAIHRAIAWDRTKKRARQGSGWALTHIPTGRTAHPGELSSKSSAEWLMRQLHAAGHGNVDLGKLSEDHKEKIQAVVRQHMEADGAGSAAPWSVNRQAAQHDRLRGAIDSAANLGEPPKRHEVKPKAHSRGSAHRRAKGFASTDKTRGNINFVHFSGSHAYATDGHRAVKLPTQGVDAGHAHRSDAKQTEINDAYPDVERLFKQTDEGTTHRAHYDAGHLRAIAEAAIAHHKRGELAGTSKTSVPMVALVHGKDGVRAEIATGAGRPTHTARGRAVTSGKGTTVLVNASYLKDAVAGHKGTVEVGLPDNDLQPFSVKRSDGEHHILMPMRTTPGEPHPLEKSAHRLPLRSHASSMFLQALAGLRRVYGRRVA